ncbi:MAG: MFS transporter [Nitrososphaerales archaeon]
MRLLIVRGLRSFSQGYLNIIAPLYLLSIGLSVTGLGLLFTASFVVGAILLVPVGKLADKYGRIPFLIAFSLLIALWGVIYAVTSWLPILFVISAIAGIGRGGAAGGSQAGPFAPAEQAILADLVPAERRVRVFSWNAFAASIFAAAGAALSALPIWLHLQSLGGDKILFVMTTIIGLGSCVILLGVPDTRHKSEKTSEKEHKPSRRPSLMSKESTGIVGRLSIASMFNSFGMGFMGSSLFVVWLNLRYHLGANVIGPVFAASYLLSALIILLAPALARRIGSVGSIISTRIAAAGLLASIVLAPTFVVAIGLYIARIVLSNMIVPVRQSFTMGLFPSEERATASGVTGATRRVTGAVSPSVSGELMNMGYLESPFLVGAIFQGFSAVLYGMFFLKKDKRDSNIEKHLEGE